VWNYRGVPRKSTRAGNGSPPAAPLQDEFPQGATSSLRAYVCTRLDQTHIFAEQISVDAGAGAYRGGPDFEALPIADERHFQRPPDPAFGERFIAFAEPLPRMQQLACLAGPNGGVQDRAPIV